MDKVITRNLLRSFHNKIKDSLGVATDPEIAAIVDGISFDDAPVVTEKRYPILYVYRYDMHWFWQVSADLSDWDKIHQDSSPAVTANLYSNDDKLIARSKNENFNRFGVVKKDTPIYTTNGVSFYDTRSFDNYARIIDDALLVDGKMVVIIDIAGGAYASLEDRDDTIWVSPDYGNYTNTEKEFINKCIGGYFTFT